MATKRDKAIQAALDAAEPASKKQQDAELDKSLRAQAFRRAESQQPPKTMTPWEWEEWYAQHGVPPSFESFDSAETANTETDRPAPFWKFWAKKPSKPVKANCSRNPNEDSEF